MRTTGRVLFSRIPTLVLWGPQDVYYFLEYQPSFREDDRADSTFQETAQTFESLCRGQVDLVKQHPVSPLQCRNQGALQRRKEMFYLTTHSTHFIYGYMESDIWLRTILIVRKETRCRHMGYSFRLTARVLLYAPSHRQDNTYHGLHQSWSTGWNEK